MKKLYIIAAAALLQTAAFAQVHKVTGPRSFFNIPAGSEGGYTFFNLETGKQVAKADSASNKWHIAFNKTKILVNSGEAGPGLVNGQLLSSDFLATKTLPSSGYSAESLSNSVVKTGSGNGWYTYDQSTNTVSPIFTKSIALKWGTTYALLQVISYYKDQDFSQESGNYTIRYQLSESTDVSQKFTKVANLYAGYAVRQLFNVANADTLVSADSTTAKWNMGFLTTTITGNSGNSGPGTTELQIVDQKYNDIILAPLSGFKQDQEGSPAIPTGSGNGWYTYDITVHSITPNANRTILMKDGLGHYAKMSIKSYYKDAPANPTFLDINTTKYYTFEYYFNPIISRELNQNNSSTLSVSEVDEVLSFGIYPNPASSELNISYPSELEKSVAKIYSVDGKLIATQSLTGNGNISINVTEVPAGAYVVKIGNIAKSLIIQ